MSLTYEKLAEEPVLRTWEVNATDSRFEYYQASPSDNALHVQFIILAAINSLVAVTTLIVICSILSSKELRINPFNWYLLFIFVPDFVMSSLCIFGCAFSATLSRFYSEWMCSFQSMYLVFGLCANCWMNVFIVYEVHRVLRFSNYRRRYFPPKRTTVMKQAFGVYLYAIAWGLLGIFPIDWLPHQTYAWYGFFCFPQEYDRASTFFYWLLFIPAIMGIPILYISYVCYDIWNRQLLPPQGRRRNLSVYFVRLILVYFFMWTPAILIRIICNFWNAGAWVSWVGAVWCHLQGFVSACVALTKPDIRKAVVRFCGISSYFKDTSPVTSQRRSNAGVGNGKKPRKSLRISLMESFSNGTRPFLSRFSSRRKSSSTLSNQKEVRPGSDQDSDDGDDMFCDPDLTESAAMRAIGPVILSLTEHSETFTHDDVHLSGFDDAMGNPIGCDAHECRPPVILEIDEEAAACSPPETDSNKQRRSVSFSHPEAQIFPGFDEERHRGNGSESIVSKMPGSDEETIASSQTEQENQEHRVCVSTSPSHILDNPTFSGYDDDEEIVYA